jgi:DNA-binding NtrC family response regulator
LYYLPKPFTPAELRSVVRQAVESLRLQQQRSALENRAETRAPVVHKLVGNSPKIKKVVEMIAKDARQRLPF